MDYIAKYAHNGNDTPGTLRLDAADDASAVEEIKVFVEGGMRGDGAGSGTWASVELSDGSACVYRNFFGQAKGGVAA